MATSEPWMTTISGTSLDLLNPSVAQVNFRDMAIALSQQNRYFGNSQIPISIAQHLIIGCDIAPPELRPWWLLHDSHEHRIGDTTSPAKQLFEALAGEMFGPEAAAQIGAVRKEAERRHDAVIHKAAGLSMPGKDQAREIACVDIIALVTEQRDFHAVQQRSWGLPVKAHSKRYTALPAPKAAEQLFTLFTRYLPALSGGTY